MENNLNEAVVTETEKLVEDVVDGVSTNEGGLKTVGWVAAGVVIVAGTVFGLYKGVKALKEHKAKKSVDVEAKVVDSESEELKA